MPPFPALLAALIACVACRPTSPTQAGGEGADPVALLTVLPSPGQLRGEPARAAGPAALQEALTGAPDSALAQRVRERAPKAAAVRSWTGGRPGARRRRQRLGLAPGRDRRRRRRRRALLDEPGARALDAARGARQPGRRAWTPPAGRPARLAFAVGPNSVYVRSRGPVPGDVVERTLRRLVLALEGLEDSGFAR